MNRLSLGLIATLAISCLLCVDAPQAAADESSLEVPTTDSSFFSCRRSYSSFGELARSKASMDFYHGLAYFGAAGGILLGGDPKQRWSGKNDFDVAIRDKLRFSAVNDREDVDLASDFTLAFSAAILPIASIGASHLDERDCIETWDMFTDVIESYGLTIFVNETVKFATGRNRPYTEGCNRGNPPSDANCGSSDRRRSFFSGHASLAAAGAGVTCSFAIRRHAWGESRTAQAAPCALGVVAAITTGALRIAADRHWGTDVLVGFGVGALVGYFDTWGPLDWLKFDTHDSKGRVSSVGMILPHAQEGHLGAQLVMVF